MATSVARPEASSADGNGASAPAHWLRLTLAPGIGNAGQRKLLSRFGLPGHIFEASRSALRDVVGDKAACVLLDNPHRDEIAQALAWSATPGNRLLTLADSDYPPALLQLADAPTLLYASGDLASLQTPAIAIVGSRSATPGGIDNAKRFASHLAGGGWSVVSGLAAGIDGAAHQGALDVGGRTIAVVGTGLDRVYPARHHTLAHAIRARGLLLSEYPLGTAPLPGNFPRRNRLIAALGNGLLVVEATRDSGSLITARLAGELGREVFAIPGSIHAPQARGCHQLIRQGAKLVETAADILEELGAPSPSIHSPDTGDAAESEHAPHPVLTALGHDACALDTLTQRSGLTADALLAILLELELAGHVASLPGGRYQRLGNP